MESATAVEDHGVAPEAFRALMSAVATPVTVVTAVAGERPHGTTVSAFCSLSLVPPLVTVALDRGSDLLGIVRDDGRFAVNLLAHDQDALARRFAVKGVDKFTGVEWSLAEGLPRLAGACGWLSCRTEAELPGGDHVLLLGRVLAGHAADRAPLVYHAHRFGTHAPSVPALPGEGA